MLGTSENVGINLKMFGKIMNVNEHVWKILNMCRKPENVGNVMNILNNPENVWNSMKML